jgi:multiple sugar transport system permease protein
MSEALRYRKVHGEGWLGKRISRAAGYGILIVTALFLFIPIFFLLVNALKVDSEFHTWPPTIFPAVPQWSNFIQLFQVTDFGPIVTRTFLLGLMFAIVSPFMTSMVGFAFARYNVWGSKQLYSIVIAMMFVPGMIFTIPQFLIFAQLHLTNTYVPWFIWALFPGSVGIFLFRQFFMNFPKELEEAAEIDGAGPWRIFFQIFLPNAKPVLAVNAIWAFSGVWTDYLTPLLFLSNDKTLLSVALQNSFVRPSGQSYITLTLAANVIYCLPLVIAFFLAQKYILKGIITTGLKG